MPNKKNKPENTAAGYYTDPVYEEQLYGIQKTGGMISGDSKH